LIDIVIDGSKVFSIDLWRIVFYGSPVETEGWHRGVSIGFQSCWLLDDWLWFGGFTGWLVLLVVWFMFITIVFDRFLYYCL